MSEGTPHVRRVGTQVHLSVDLDIPNYEARVFTFCWECGTGHEIYAGLLSKKLSSAILESRDRMYSQGYLAGWADAKAKRRKLIQE